MQDSPTVTRQTDRSIDYAVRHLRFGWWSLLVFLSVGFVLELLHGFKAGFYLDVTSETRRLMWTLAHAHGALLSVVHVAWALCLRAFPDLAEAGRPRAVSRCLMAASVLLPGGFFAGGVQLYGGDPGPGIAAVPAGAACLGIGVFLTARAARRCDGRRSAAGDAPPPAAPGAPRAGNRGGRRR